MNLTELNTNLDDGLDKMPLNRCRLGFKSSFGFKMADRTEDWFLVTSKELEENEDDHGSMFCEDCRNWHHISYSQAFSDRSKLDFLVLGFYECGEQTCLWSIDGKRVD